MKVLEVQNLVKKYGSLKAVNDVSFDIKEGEVLGLLGPNGAGKTTLISTIMTLEKPSSGDIFVCGWDIRKHSQKIKSIIGFMPQELVMHGYFNLEEVIRFYSGFCGVWPDNNRIEYLLKKLDLWQHRKKKVRALSGGMKRRMLMVKALVHSPKLILLDEPTAGVDMDFRSSIWDFVTTLKNEGASILFTTHYLEEAEKLCDRVAFIHEGKIRQMGVTKTLISDLTTRQIHLKLKGNSNFNPEDHKNYRGLREGYHVFMLPYSSSLGQLVEQLSVGIEDISDVRIREGSLEDVFQISKSQKLDDNYTDPI